MWDAVGPIASIDDGTGEISKHTAPLPNEMTHDDKVSIVAHYGDGIFQCLPWWWYWWWGIAESYHPAAQTVDCRLETETGAGGRLKNSVATTFPSSIF